MANLRVAAVVGAVLGSGAACHLVGGLSDLDYQDPAPTGGSSAGSTSTSAGSGGTGTATPTGGSGGVGGGGGSQPACHPPGLVDEFEVAPLDTSLWGSWSDTGVTVGVADGYAFVEPPPSSTTVSLSGEIYSLVTSYDLTDCQTWVEVVSAFDESVPGNAWFEIYYDGSNDAEINIQQGMIEFEIEIDGGFPASSSIAYSPSAHRWLRIRDEAGTLYQETSPDGVVWTVQISHQTPWWIGQVQVDFGARIWDASSQPGRVKFDNLNAPP